MFPKNLTAKLTGVTVHQLDGWRRSGLIVPEVSLARPPLYSFRDLVALRSIAFLRADISLQKIHQAFDNLDVLNMVEHPSAYRFATDGRTIYVEGPHDEALDLVRNVGQGTIFTFEEMTQEFDNFRGTKVANFLRPAAHLQVAPERLGGWPTVTGTRIGYEVIANLIDGDSVTVEEVEDYYPGVSAAAARDAIQFDAEVRQIA